MSTRDLVIGGLCAVAGAAAGVVGCYIYNKKSNSDISDKSYAKGYEDGVEYEHAYNEESYNTGYNHGYHVSQKDIDKLSVENAQYQEELTDLQNNYDALQDEYDRYVSSVEDEDIDDLFEYEEDDVEHHNIFEEDQDVDPGDPLADEVRERLQSTVFRGRTLEMNEEDE